MVVLGAESVLLMALRLLKWPEKRLEKTGVPDKLRHFRLVYGVHLDSFMEAAEDLDTSPDEEIRALLPYGVQMPYMLMACHWLKNYIVEAKMRDTFDFSEPTIRKYCHLYSRCLQLQKQYKVRQGGRYCQLAESLTVPRKIIFEYGRENFILTVDGTHCPTHEPRNAPSALWYSHKFKGPGVAYEIAVSIRDSRIMWTNGPYPAGTNDKKIFNMGLVDEIPDGKAGIADNGYKRQPKLSLVNKQDSEEVAKFKDRALGRHETVNNKLKSFAILSHKFRHLGTGDEVLERHKVVFEAVAVLVQYDMENASPMYDV